jgi:hypothetical protein
MDFYHDLITGKSWELLKKLGRKYDFILIGGWAIYLYTRALKSKDIDLVLNYEGLEKFKKDFEVLKNNRLRKYEVKSGGLDIDIYVPFYSNPGLPAEELKKYVCSLEGFSVVEKEVLAILKGKALLERENTLKGRKDLIDLVSLFRLPDFDFKRYQKIIKEYKLEQILVSGREIIQRTPKIEELGINVHQMAGLKKKILPPKKSS